MSPTAPLPPGSASAAFRWPEHSECSLPWLFAGKGRKKKKRRKKTREGEKFNVVLTCDFVPSMIKNKLRGLRGMNDDLDNDNHGDELKEERKISNKM